MCQLSVFLPNQPGFDHLQYYTSGWDCMDNMGMSSSSDLYILYTSALTPPLPSMCMKPWWCHINNKLIRGPAACVIKYHQYCVSPIRQLLHWKCSNWLFKQVQVMYCIQYANGKSCHIQYTNETTVVTRYSAPEQVSQLLKIFIESFLSSKRVWNTYHLLF